MKRIGKIGIFGILLALIVAVAWMRMGNTGDTNLQVQDYFPRVPMEKEFSGGFENAGYTHRIDYIMGDKVQLIQEDTGARMVMIHEVSPEGIKQVFRKQIDEEPVGINYIEGFVPNHEGVLLKAPIQVGTKWNDDDGGQYEITKVNKRVTTPAGKYDTIEVTFIKEDFKVKRYYAKEIGLVMVEKGSYGKDELLKVTYND